jgi:hypothetical protein
MGRETKDYLVNCGRVITTEELADIRETVAMCSGLSRNELALTIGEHLAWYSASETQGLLSLPAKQSSSGRPRKALPLTERTAAGEPLEGIIGDLGTVQVVPVTEVAEIGLWNEYVNRYHYLGYLPLAHFRKISPGTIPTRRRNPAA